jgi:MerR family transcriptional regulator, light-induced transcriptional regulator
MIKETYTIKELEIISGIKSSSIRMWEKRYGLMSPVRTETNFRRYTKEDLRKILQIAYLINKGNKPNKLALLSTDQISEICQYEFLNMQSESSYINELLLRMIDKDIEGFELQFDKILDKMLAAEFVVSVLEPLIEKIRQLWLVRSVEPFYEEYFLNRIIIKALVTAEKERKSGRSVREILIFQADTKTIPAKLSLVYFLAAIKNYKIHFYFNQLSPETICEMKGKINPDLVYTEFNDKITDNKLVNYFKTLEDTFPAAKNIVSGRIMNDSWKIIPNKVYYIRNLEVLNKSL